MKKALNITQTIIESVLQSAVLTLIVLGFMMAMTSCSGQKQYVKKKNDWMTKKKYDTAKHNKKCRSYTCYEW
jgi:Pyruvate/2-oxoacid:ferredoxin oxidoreductase gamma subunit